MQNSSPGTEVKHATATPVSVPVMTRKSKCAMCLAHQVISQLTCKPVQISEARAECQATDHSRIRKM